MSLDNFDLTEGSPVLLLDPNDMSLSGDVTADFKPGVIAY